jgi:ankyrin repeat protein
LYASAANSNIVRWLQEGAEVDEKDSNGMTALHCAAKGGHVDCIVALLEAGADIGVQSAV